MSTVPLKHMRRKYTSDSLKIRKYFNLSTLGKLCPLPLSDFCGSEKIYSENVNNPQNGDQSMSM